MEKMRSVLYLWRGTLNSQAIADKIPGKVEIRLKGSVIQIFGPGILKNFACGLQYIARCESQDIAEYLQDRERGNIDESRILPTDTRRRSPPSVPTWRTGPPRLRVQLQPGVKCGHSRKPAPTKQTQTLHVATHPDLASLPSNTSLIHISSNPRDGTLTDVSQPKPTHS